VYTHSSSGDSSEWNNVTGLRIPDSDTSYMVTVMAEGYRLCGGYFKAGPHEAAVTVDMVCQKHPLPLGTIRMFIFHDIARKCYCGWLCLLDVLPWILLIILQLLFLAVVNFNPCSVSTYLSKYNCYLPSTFAY